MMMLYLLIESTVKRGRVVLKQEKTTCQIRCGNVVERDCSVVKQLYVEVNGKICVGCVHTSCGKGSCGLGTSNEHIVVRFARTQLIAVS